MFDIFELEKIQIYNINTTWNRAESHWKEAQQLLVTELKHFTYKAKNKLHYLNTIQCSLLFSNKSNCCEITQFYF